MKIRIFVLWFAAAVVAFGQQVTPNIGLLIQTPPQYANNWGAITNYNFQKIDTAFAGVGSQWRGAWSSVTAYTAGNFVSYLGNYYLAIQNSTNQNPVTQTAYWVQVNGSGGSGGGVQYNPTTTYYIVASWSGLYDDLHQLSSAVAVSSWTQSGTRVTVNTSTADNLTAGKSYVDLSSMTGWSGNQTAGVGSFLVQTTPSTTQFTITTSTSNTPCASSCGNIYDASYWAFYRIATEPYFYGHGTMYGIEDTAADLDTNFATLASPLCASTGPNFLITAGLGINDLYGGASAATVEGHLKSIWAKAHAAGCRVVGGSIPSADATGAPFSYYVNAGLVSRWAAAQSQQFSNVASGQFWDNFIDYQAYLFDANGVGGGGNMYTGYAPAASKLFADITNAQMANQSSFLAEGPIFSNNASNLLVNNSGTWTWVDNLGNEWMTFGCCGNNGSYLGITNQFIGNGPSIELFDTHTSGSRASLGFGHSSATNKEFYLNYTESNPSDNQNYASISVNGGGGDNMRWYADQSVSIPSVATSPSTSPICPGGANGTLTTSDCSGGGGLNGTVTYTSSQTAASGDNGKLVIMNCSGACAYTLPATQPSTTWQIALQSVGSTTATLGLSGDTYNGGATAPVLPNYYTLSVWANTATSTDYRGGTPPVSGTNVTITPAANGQTFASSGSGGAAPSATFSIATGAAASPAAPYVLAPASGTVSDCYWTTLTSDGSTNLVFNVKFNGTNILSGTNATVTAGDTPGSSHTFSLTSGTITITQGQKWELDITTGTTNWTGAVQCY